MDSPSLNTQGKPGKGRCGILVQISQVPGDSRRSLSWHADLVVSKAQSKNSSWNEAPFVTKLALKCRRRAESHLWLSQQSCSPHLSRPIYKNELSIRMNFPSCILGVNIFTCDSLTLYKQKSVVKYSGKQNYIQNIYSNYNASKNTVNKKNASTF